MNSEPKQVGWLFVVWWTGLTIVGGLVGNYVTDKLFAGLQASNTYLGILFSVLGSGVFGLTVSAAQWILLRRYIPKTIWWMITGTAGRAFGALIGSIFVWMLGNTLNLQDDAWSGLIIYVVVRGTVLGAFQWAFLKQFRTQTGWWVLGNGIGWMLGHMIAIFFLASKINDFIIQIMVEVLAGIITGTLIFWILHQPNPEQNKAPKVYELSFWGNRKKKLLSILFIAIGVFVFTLPYSLLSIIFLAAFLPALVNFPLGFFYLVSSKLYDEALSKGFWESPSILVLAMWFFYIGIASAIVRINSRKGVIVLYIILILLLILNVAGCQIIAPGFLVD